MSDLDIMHIDMDAFFAAIEQIDNPELRGKPVIVGGTSLNERGVVATASYEARRYGVHSAMPITEARNLCPDGIYLPVRKERYHKMSEKIYDIFCRFTPQIERISIDEAFLDLKGCHRLFGSSEEIGNKIKKLIKEETKLIASVGIAPNKFLAKLASDLEKPDGFVVIKREEIKEFLETLPISKLWGVGKKTEKILLNRGIKTVGMLKKFSRLDLKSLLGKMGEKLYFLARGIDKREVEIEQDTKSVSHEKTFVHNLSDEKTILSVLLVLSERVSRRLRLKGLLGKTVFLKVRYQDFTTLTRRITGIENINSTEKLYRVGKKLSKEHNLFKKPLRLLGIGVSNLTAKENKQLSLFSSNTSCKELISTIDNIKDRFGDDSIQRARNLIYKNMNSN